MRKLSSKLIESNVEPMGNVLRLIHMSDKDVRRENAMYTDVIKNQKVRSVDENPVFGDDGDVATVTVGIQWESGVYKKVEFYSDIWLDLTDLIVDAVKASMGDRSALASIQNHLRKEIG